MIKKYFSMLIFGCGVSFPVLASFSGINIESDQSIEIDISQVSGLANARLAGEPFNKNGSILLDNPSAAGFQWLPEQSIDIFWQGHLLKRFTRITHPLTFVLWDSSCEQHSPPVLLEMQDKGQYQSYRHCYNDPGFRPRSRITLSIGPHASLLTKGTQKSGVRPDIQLLEKNYRSWMFFDIGESGVSGGTLFSSSARLLDVKIRVDPVEACDSGKDLSVLARKMATVIVTDGAGEGDEPSDPDQLSDSVDIPGWIADLLELYQGQQDLHQFLMSLVPAGETMTFSEFAVQVQGAPTHEDGHQAINLVRLLLFIRQFGQLEERICQSLYPSS